MDKIIRVSLVCLILMLLRPASTNATSSNEDGNEYQSYQTGSECGADSDCPQLPPSIQPNEMNGNNLLSWKGNGVPVLEAGPGGSWDESGVIGPAVLHTWNNYLLWYSGISEDTFQIGYATSKNGLAWEKHPDNPVLTVGEPGSWDEQKVWAPAVLHNSSIWEMWYVGYSDVTGSQIGYATSLDGQNWVKYWDNPVLSPSFFDEWESSGLISPHVLFENGLYHMWYSNDPQGYIGYAVSSDGVHWERYPANPLISPIGGDEDCSSVKFVSPTILHLEEYHMWYQAGQSCRGGVGGFWIVHSTSPDGVTWSDPEWVYGMGVGISMNAHYPTVISRHKGLLKQMWYVYCGKIYYAEENQLNSRLFLPFTMH